jgi:CRP-like cAMP-binding protein
MAEINLDDVSGLPEEKFGGGATILEEGKEGRRVFVLKEGSVSVMAAGNELCKANAPGTIFGEISVLLDGTHTATVVAEEDCSFYVIDSLMNYLEEHPKTAIEVAKVLATRVMNMNLHYLEIKHEIERMQDDPAAASSSGRLFKILQKVDQFWGRNIF